MNPEYRNPKCLIRYLFLRLLPTFCYPIILKIVYRKKLGFCLNLKTPRKISEKIQWMKLYDHSSKKTFFTDKLAVKEYIAKNFPELKFAKVFQIADSFENLDFEKLPNSFIIKTNHACSTNSYVLDKKEITRAQLENYKKNYNWVLKIDFAYWNFYEFQYKNIKPQIFVEELLFETDSFEKLINYEVYCFNGKPEFIVYRNIAECFQQYVYSTSWKRLNFDVAYGNNEEIPIPLNLEKILHYSSELSKDFNFVRVDFMEYENEIAFCEMTFTPYSGFIEFNPNIVDLYYGNKLK